MDDKRTWILCPLRGQNLENHHPNGKSSGKIWSCLRTNDVTSSCWLGFSYKENKERREKLSFMADSLNCHIQGQANSGAQLPESLSKRTGCGWATWRNVNGGSTSESAMLAQGWYKRVPEILHLCSCITNCSKTYWLITTMIISLGFVVLLGHPGGWRLQLMQAIDWKLTGGCHWDTYYGLFTWLMLSSWVAWRE